MSQGYEITNHYVMRQILDEVILVPVSPLARERNQMLVLNPSAAFFFQGIRDGKPRSDIERIALEHFEGLSPSSFHADFDEFVREMEKLEAIRANTPKG